MLCRPVPDSLGRQTESAAYFFFPVSLLSWSVRVVSSAMTIRIIVASIFAGGLGFVLLTIRRGGGRLVLLGWLCFGRTQRYSDHLPGLQVGLLGGVAREGGVGAAHLVKLLLGELLALALVVVDDRGLEVTDRHVAGGLEVDLSKRFVVEVLLPGPLLADAVVGLLQSVNVLRGTIRRDFLFHLASVLNGGVEVVSGRGGRGGVLGHVLIDRGTAKVPSLAGAVASLPVYSPACSVLASMIVGDELSVDLLLES